jgi:hypothetical protein
LSTVVLARQRWTTDRAALAGFVLLAFAFPLIFAAAFFPTPAEDLREQINWGAVFPFHTWKHPPLQSWLAGLVALSNLRDAWPYVLAAQLVNFVGLLYAVRIAREFIDPRLEWPVAIAYCASISISAEVLVSALNADQIQGPLWLAVLYHALRATREDKWSDWVMCGACAGLALLTKYFSAVFLGAMAMTFVMQTPRLLRKPKAYVAIAICLALSAIYLVPVLFDLASLAYFERLFHSAKPHTVLPILRIAGSLIVYELPLLLALGTLWKVGQLRRQSLSRQGADRVITVTTAIVLTTVVGLVVLAQMKYYLRYTVPLLPLCVLSLFCIVRPRPDATALFAQAGFRTWAVGTLAALTYALTYGEIPLREPADTAAALIRADWERQYRCGPAYVVGEKLSAHAIGLYYGNSVTGLSLDDYRRAHWVDQERILQLGLVVVTNAGMSPESILPEAGPREGPVTTLRLPLRRSLDRGEHVYRYQFVPPRNC